MPALKDVFTTAVDLDGMEYPADAIKSDSESDATEDEDTNATAKLLATRQAPKGGITIEGQTFRGGQFIPGDLLLKVQEAENTDEG